MKIEISNGELIDKWTILRIRLEHIEAEDALANVQREYDLLSEGLKQLELDPEIVNDLLLVNWALWDVEDKLRQLESEQSFGEEFVEAARSVYLLNDNRARIKREINEQTNSLLVEEKSYSTYEVPADD